MQRYPKKSRNPRQGFTLLEVMVVLFILVTLAGLAIVALRGQQEKAQRQGELVYVKMLSGALERYSVDIGHPPTQDQGLNALLEPPADVSTGKWGGPYLKESAVKTIDSWGNQYQYICPGTRTKDGYDVWSFGPDGINGTDDDIGQWTKE
jgi:general secretion pathway protein G